MNHLAHQRLLHNTYWLLRHGQSVPNERGIIVSNQVIAIRNEWKLTQQGCAQIEASMRDTELLHRVPLVFVTSWMSRHRESAHIAENVVIKRAHMRGSRAVTEMFFTQLANERFFGKYDLGSTIVYPLIWEHDAIDPTHTEGGVESVMEVLQRMTFLVTELERKYKQKHIIIVSSGDPLQILQAAFCGLDPGSHGNLKHLENGELRKMTLLR